MVEIKEVVEYLVKLIVDKPEEVEIAEKQGSMIKPVDKLLIILRYIL